MMRNQGSRTNDPLDCAGVAFHPPLLLVLMLVAGSLVTWAVPLAPLPRSVARWLGPAVSLASFMLFLWAVYSMRAAGASIPTHKSTEVIVTRGPYRYSRNPIYLAMVLLQVGIGIWVNSLWFFLSAIISAILLWHGVISREEDYLTRKFGNDYARYKAQVRRWL